VRYYAMGAMQFGPEDAARVRVGEVLAGKYRVERVLGAGGMGVVVAAHHLALDERVALKFLLPAALGSADAIGRFAREARAAVKIKSEHVARVIDVGTLETGAPFIVMEFLEGSDLSAWIRQKGRLEVEQAVEFILQASEAIAEAHVLGIIHRDLKPANLFVVRRADGLHSIKVLDFGISKLTAMRAFGPDMASTNTSEIMGSPFYMSPEQLKSSKDVDVRADIWALGVILYELLAGKTPFFGETFTEVCMKIATDAPPPLRSVRPDAPAGLEAAIGKCLEKDRRERYANVAELALALEGFGPRRARTSVERISRVIQTAGLAGTRLEGPVSADPSNTLQPTQTAAPLGRTSRGASSRKKVAAAVVAVACALGVGASVSIVIARRNAPPPPDPSAAPSAAATHSEPSSAPALTSSRPAASAFVMPAPPSVASVPPPTNVPVRSESSTRTAPPAKTSVHASALPRNPLPAPVSERAVALPSAASPAPSSPATSPAPPSAAPPPRTAPTADCDPPYYFDAKGTRVFKKECL
jgi:serine/threonine protein kinase